MSDALSPAEIEALFARADRGAVPVQEPTAGAAGGPASGKRTRWLRTVDFSRPTKFSTDQERRLRRLVEAFCGQATQRLMAEHRLTMALEVIDVQQLTFVDAFKLLPAPSLHATLLTAPHGTRMLLSSEGRLMGTAVEALLGGDPGVADDRPLTEIDRRIARRLMDAMVGVLSGLLYEQTETTLELVDVHASDETVQIAANSEATLLITTEARLHGVSATVALLVPYTAIAPFAGAFARRQDAVAVDDPGAEAAVRTGLSRVQVALRAEVASVEVSLDELLALRPGDVLKLEGSAADPVQVLADRTLVHLARAGRSNGRRAVQVLRPASSEGDT